MKILIMLTRGGAQGGHPPPHHFSTKMRPKGPKKIFFEAGPPLSQGLDDRPPTPLPLIWRSGSVPSEACLGLLTPVTFLVLIKMAVIRRNSQHHWNLSFGLCFENIWIHFLAPINHIIFEICTCTCTQKRGVNRGMQIRRSVVFLGPIHQSDLIFVQIRIRVTLKSFRGI